MDLGGDAMRPADEAFVDRLLHTLAESGPPKLSDDDLARLEAHLGRPMRLSLVQQEKRRHGESEYLKRRDGLKEVLDYNRSLRAAGGREGSDTDSDETHDGRPAKGARATAAEYNVRARDYLKEHPLATSRELADAIGCGLGTVPGLPAWRAVMEARKAGRVPRCVALTDGLQGALGAEDAELRRLMQEQESDRRETGHGYEDDDEAPRHRFTPRRKP
jgi:hypothetical protein